MTTQVWESMTSEWHVFDGTCLAVEVEVEKSVLDVDYMSIGVALAVGLIGGALLMLLCAKCCMKDIAKKKNQDAETGYIKTKGAIIHEKQLKKKNVKMTQAKSSMKRSTKITRKKKLGFSNKKQTSLDEEGPLLPISNVSLDDTIRPIPIGTDPGNESSGEGGEDRSMRGLVDALMQTTGEGMDAEMSFQDLVAVTDLERELREESIMTMIQLLRTMLNNQLGKGRLTPQQCKDLMQGVQNDVDDVIKACQREKEEEEEDLRKKIKNPNKLQGELDKLHSKYILRMSTLMYGVKDNLRHELGKKTDLSDDEIDLMMARHAENMAAMEHKLSRERTRQTVALEARLARRKQLAEAQLSNRQQQDEEVDVRHSINDRILCQLVTDGKMLDRQKDELLSNYDNDVLQIHRKHKEEHERQQLVLAEKLHRNRQRQMGHLQQHQEEQRDLFLQSSDSITKSSNVVEGYHALLGEQRLERESRSEQLDHQEAEEFHRLAKHENDLRKKDMEEEEEKFQGSLRSHGQVSDHDISHIMQIHQQEMNQYEKAKKVQKKRQKALLEENLARRKMKAEEEQLQLMSEQKAIKEQQDATLDKVLKSQVEIDEDVKMKIMNEHEQNMAAINNQLQMSRLRQQKALEQKLNQRKAKVADLKLKAEDIKREKHELKKNEKDTLDRNLQKEIADEERKKKKVPTATLR